MRVHNIVDFNPIYYKYWFRLNSDKIRRLTSGNKDISLIYYSLKEIEGYREKLEKDGNEVVTTVCFDSKNLRKTLLSTEESDGYKEGRVKRFTEEDFENIDEIMEMLEKANVNVLKVDGAEADDLVKYACDQTRDRFDYIVLYTNDKDLLTNVRGNVGAMRYKSKDGWTLVTEKNYKEYVEKEFKATIPYNTISLFLSMVGDTGDHLKGIKGFGAVAYSRTMAKIDSLGKFKWEEMGDYDKVAEVIKESSRVLDEEQVKQAINTFNIVRPIEITDNLEDEGGRVIDCGDGFYKIQLFYDKQIEDKVSTREIREEAYSRYAMVSLYK